MARDFFIFNTMPLTRDQKGEILKELAEEMKKAKAVVFADFQGLSVKDIKDLRKQMREKGVKYKIAKKTLIKISAKEAGYQDIPDETLAGPVGAAFSMEDELSAAKIIHQFAKKNDKLKLRGALFEGRVLSIAETRELALLPGKEELLAKLVYMMKYPIQGFHDVLLNTVGGFVRVLNAIKDKQPS